ncbi:4-hydroxy-2-oxovalerate aldolase [Candidatus Paraburkholderia kirkii]|nr:4-hydroxy-2-oxovalerate aldolase [Candidatus Paraburkholderia kirkii]
MNLKGKRITVHDMTLRDGMHPKRHQMTLGQMRSIATGLDEARVPLIEVTHGDGLGGSSINYGFPAHTDAEYLGAVIPLLKRAKVSALLLPGIGTVDHLKEAYALGVHTIRVATHCTEVDVSEQHIAMARKLDMQPNTELGFHGHHDLAMGVANSIAAIEAGANRIDGVSAGLGAGAGNTPLEVFVAVCERMGIETGVDVWKIQDVAEDLVVPMMDFPLRIDRDALTLGYAGVYGAFLLFAKRAGDKYRIPAHDILVELGRRGMVGGQENMIEDTALTLAKARAAQAKREAA